MRSKSFTRMGRFAPPALLLLACAGCSAGTGGAINSASAPVPTAASDPQAAPAPAAWWREVGDPVLSTLIQHGLDNSAEVACRVASLRRYDEETEREARRLGSRIGRLLGDRSGLPDPAVRDDKVLRVAERRDRLASRIAHAYVEVRRLQQQVAMRAGLRAQFKDNAEVARFRKEAGLVPAIDGSLAGSQDESAQAELGFAQGSLGTALNELARLVGMAPADLAARIVSPGTLAEPPSDPLQATAPDDPRRAAIADALLREARVAQGLENARRTVRDARIAYREGAGSFATLYVAEVASLSMELALADARAARITATFDLLAEKDRSWAREGLSPVVAAVPSAPGAPITVNAACD